MPFAGRTPRWVQAILSAALAACADVSQWNPYDPGAPAEQQRRASITGHIELAERGAHAAGIQVRVLGPDGKSAVNPRDGAPVTVTAVAAPGDGENRGLATFLVGELPAGTYGLAIDVDPRFVGPLIAETTLAPGEVRDLHTLTYNVRDAGTARVSGVVETRDAEGGPRLVQLLRSTGSGLQLVGQARTDSLGAFAFVNLPGGTYAVSAELEGFTPDYRAGFRLEEPTPGGLANDVQFKGATALVLHPVSAVLLPVPGVDSTGFYTSTRTMRLAILKFGNMDEMRLSTDPRFVDANGEALPFSPHQAITDVPLPAEQGPLQIHAQFATPETEGFRFLSAAFDVTIIRDATKPVVNRLALRGAPIDAAGVTWVGVIGATATIDIEANDVHSAIATIAIEVADQVSDPATLMFEPVYAPGGLARISHSVGLGAGEGVRTIWVHLADRAGNRSDPGRLDVHVDGTPPVATLVVDDGTGFALSPDVRVNVDVVEDGGAPVTAFQLSNGATFDGPALAPGTPVAWTLGTPDLDGRKTLRAKVFDAAGHSSVVEQEIELDTSPPDVNVAIEQGATYARTLVAPVRVQGDGGDGFGYAISTLALDCASATYLPFDGDVTIPCNMGSEGPHTVWACVRKPSGRTALASADVIVDTVAPTPGSGAPVVVIGQGAPAVTSEIVTLFLAPFAGDPVRVKLLVRTGIATANKCIQAPVFTDADFANVVPTGYAASMTYVLPPNEQATNAGSAPRNECKYVAAIIGDLAGNWTHPSSSAVAAVLVDALAPNAPRIVTGDQITEAPTADVVLAAPSADHHFDAYQYRLAGAPWRNLGDASATALACETHATPCRCDATAANRPCLRFDLLQNAVNRISVRAVDVAGNASTEDAVVVRHDTVRPAKPPSVEVEPGNGQAAVKWASSADPDVEGYLVFYGPADGVLGGTNASQGPSPLRIGLQNQFLLSGLPNGVPVFVAVAALDHLGTGALATPDGPVVPNEMVPVVVPPTGAASGVLLTPPPTGAQFRAGVAINGVLWVTHGCLGSTCSTAGVSAYDLSDPATPSLLGSCRDTAFRTLTDIAVAGDYAYVPDGNRVAIIDVSEPRALSDYATKPVCSRSFGWTGRADGRGTALSAAISGGYLYVGRDLDGLAIYSLANPTAPALVKLYNDTAISGFVDGWGAKLVRAQGNLVYVTGFGSPLWIYDVSTPTNPERKFTYSAGGSRIFDIEPAGNLLFLAMDASLQVLRINPGATEQFLDPQSAIMTRRGWHEDVLVDGPYAYVTQNDGLGVLALDRISQGTPGLRLAGFSRAPIDRPSGSAVQNPSSQVILGTTHVEVLPADIRSDGVLLDAGGLIVRRLAAPQAPRRVGSVDVLPRANSGGEVPGGVNIDSYRGWAVLGRMGAVTLVDVRTPSLPATRLTVSPTGASPTISAARVVGDHVYLATSNGLTDYEIRGDPATEITLAEKANWINPDTTQYAGQLLVQWPYAFVINSVDAPYTGWYRTTNPRLLVVDLRTMTLVGQLQIEYDDAALFIDIAYYARRIYLTTHYDPKVWIVDVSTPAAPTLAGTITPSDGAILWGLGIVGDRLWVSTANDVRPYTLANPGTPSPLTPFPASGAFWQRFTGGLLFAGSSSYSTGVLTGTNVWDVSDAMVPRLRGQLPEGSRGLFVTGKTLLSIDADTLYVSELR